MRELKGRLEGRGLRIGIVAAKFNEVITARLLRGALTALYDHAVALSDIDVARVPGSFEVPVVARAMAMSGNYDAVICLGAVIKGETDHYAHIAGEAARGIASASAETGVPVIFGILTTNTVDQALDRSGGQDGDSVKELLYQRKSGPGGSILKGERRLHRRARCHRDGEPHAALQRQAVGYRIPLLVQPQASRLSSSLPPTTHATGLRLVIPPGPLWGRASLLVASDSFLLTCNEKTVMLLA